MNNNPIVIIDYGMGNINSVKRKFYCLGIDTVITSDPATIAGAYKLILPGVGHFQKAIEKLKQLQIFDALNDSVLGRKIPVLGICLGMQLMAKHSEEGNADGFGWFDADVVKFKVSDRLKFKVPHMGWNNTVIEKDSPLFEGISREAMYYFVHSYHLNCYQKEDILATTEYDYPFTSAIQKDNIFGTQFHPEKSHDWGEQIFRNFAKL
jgi:imidazole glycerol-phosphate synthase subunit HisH